tara:strand:+ start:1365 stop:1946 length:582 start_codon:yes stop_codon:yes gene_type:complete
MINHDLQYIFIHIPKTGGNSVKKVLGIDCHSHRALREYKVAFSVLQLNSKFKTYFKFCFVRNPFDRFVSAYNYLKNGGISPMDKADCERFNLRNRTFKDFVLSQEGILSQQHFKPQSHYTNPQEDLDFIGRLENFDIDFLNLCDLLKIPPCQPPHLNNSSHSHYTEYYDSESRKAVERLYGEDLEAFGYNFGD